MLDYLGTHAVDIAKNEATWCHRKVWNVKNVPMFGRGREIWCSDTQSSGQTPIWPVVAGYTGSWVGGSSRLAWVSDLIPRFWGRNIFFGMLIFIMLGWTWYLVCVGSNCCVYDPLLHISILRIISTHFMEKCTVHTHSRLPTSLKAGQGKNTTFDFTGSSRCFRLNKSVLETKETKHTDSQLHFAPKIIKIGSRSTEKSSKKLFCEARGG